MMMLADRSVIVTGAGAGLGRAYALACADAGAFVVVNDVNAAAAERVSAHITAAGGRAIADSGSVASWDDMRDLVAACVGKSGRLDALVANAAIRHEALPWDEAEADLRRTVDINVLGVQFPSVHAMRAMVDAGTGGAILTVVSGARLGLGGMSAYGASKGAVAAMTAGWAVDGVEVGIRVNALSPLAATDMSRSDTRTDISAFPDPQAVAPVVPAILAESFRGMTGRVIRFDGHTLTPYALDRLDDRSVARSAWDSSTIAGTLGEWFGDAPMDR